MEFTGISAVRRAVDLNFAECLLFEPVAGRSSHAVVVPDDEGGAEGEMTADDTALLLLCGHPLPTPSPFT